MQFADLDLQHLSEAQMRGVRGKRISMIMQDPKYSLNPVVCVGKQIAEAWLTHHPGRKDEAKAEGAGDAGGGAYSPAGARLSALSA